MKNQFADNLKRIRKENNLSQEQLADELGVSRQAISKWESGVAYPEMDKIIALCDKFNLNIDDLLHNDIKEINNEKESKKSINNYIDDTLNFITDTINMFSSMTNKNRIKCIFEQLIIIIVLAMVSSILSSICNNIFTEILQFIPRNVSSYIVTILSVIVNIFFTIATIIIVIHVFKTRYLNYYVKEKTEEEKETTPDENNKEEEDNIKTEKINKEEKIIIRDPNHSEYKFINGLFKLLIIMFKGFLLLFSIEMIGMLVALLIGFILSFLVYKTGLFFIGLLFAFTSSITIIVILLLLIFNFVFNRKSNKKAVIWSFIISIIAFGLGCGLISLGTLNFEITDHDDSIMKTEIKEHQMNNNLIIKPNEYDDIEFKEKNINNIEIEYSLNKYCDINESIDKNNRLHAYTDCSEPTKMIKDVIKEINNKKLVPLNTDVNSIIVYASKDNIKILKENRTKYLEEIERQEENNRFEDLEEENERLEERISDLEDELNECEEKDD